MKYERLTVKEIEDFTQRACVQLCPELTQQLLSMAMELIEYKKKIEQGTFIKLHCKNIAEMHPTNGFTCSECGKTIIDFREERVDEDCTASWYEYEMKYCPNCGAKIVY